ncbi:MAG: WecB/TagA/CpsF family glycosyltransferase [Pseudorhizobium sp.]
MSALDMAVPVSTAATSSALRQRRIFLGAGFDLLSQPTVLEMLRNSAPEASFRYVVTPNADYVVRMKSDARLRQCVRDAWLSVCDSRPICGLARLLLFKLPLVTGSDLTAELFRHVICKGDRIAMIAPSQDVVARMHAAYPDVEFSAFVPPFGVLNDAQAMQDCVDFVVQAQARFVFLAIGSPQSDILAHRLSDQPDARGIGLCVGASLEFLVGTKRRAPKWIRSLGLEWLHRMLSDPRRLWRRYCYGVVPLLTLFTREIAQRAHHTR